MSSDDPSTPAQSDAPADPDADTTNVIRRTVEEICGLMGEVHEIREELLAHGVHFHMLNALIELGVHDKPEELAKMKATAIEASVAAHGPEAITEDELARHLDAIVTLEKDLRHVRHVAGQQGVHMQAMNHLTQLMRLNPGDGGVQAINTFVAYADAARVPLDRVRPILDGIREEKRSVLPDIPHDPPEGAGAAAARFARDVGIGLALTVLVMWIVV